MVFSRSAKIIVPRNGRVTVKGVDVRGKGLIEKKSFWPTSGLTTFGQGHQRRPLARHNRLSKRVRFQQPVRPCDFSRCRDSESDDRGQEARSVLRRRRPVFLLEPKDADKIPQVRESSNRYDGSDDGKAASGYRKSHLPKLPPLSC